MLARAEAVENSGAKEQEKSLLSDRQIEVLRLIAMGLSSSEIAKKLTVSYYTVKSHIHRRKGTHSGILARLNTHSIREAVIKAVGLGFFHSMMFASEEELERCQSLTGRELEVLSWLANPDLPSLRKTSVEIADKLSGQVTARTVKSHLTNIYRELGLVNKGPYISSTRATVIYLAYKRRKEATSPSHETPHELSEAGG